MKILIADDDALSRTLLKRLLERSGYQVEAVADGEAAIRSLAAEDGPRIAILDWMMPGADGPAVCRTVRAKTNLPYVYLLLLTSRESIDDVVAGFDAGADDYLTKPYNVDELRVRLRVGQRCLQLQDDLIHEALHDTLTKLPNRTFFVKRLSRSVDLARDRKGYQFSLLFIDIDRFKMVNDSLGHSAGDELMRAVAQRLLAAVRTETSTDADATHRRRHGTPGDVVARIGGDEFVVLLDDFADVTDGVRVAERILSVLEVPFQIAGKELFISASIGIACSEGRDTVASEILRGADAAMYRAKLLGKARYAINAHGPCESSADRIDLERHLRQALDNREMAVHYQPIVRLSDLQIAGFEALARWQHPFLGHVSPTSFIPLAEETGMILGIGAWILEEACLQAEVWNNGGMAVTISVNVSPVQYCQEDLLARIRSTLARTGLGAGSLSLEVTENLTMQNAEQAASVLRDIQSLGVSISLDDFGTGYSSLGYLLRFPINTLKIDRSFVAGIEDSVEKAAIVQTIITLAHNLDMTVVAEGIENARQSYLLTAWQCDYGQGYFFSAGVPASVATVMLERQSFGSRGIEDVEFTEGCECRESCQETPTLLIN